LCGISRANKGFNIINGATMKIKKRVNLAFASNIIYREKTTTFLDIHT